MHARHSHRAVGIHTWLHKQKQTQTNNDMFDVLFDAACSNSLAVFDKSSKSRAAPPRASRSDLTPYVDLQCRKAAPPRPCDVTSRSWRGFPSVSACEADFLLLADTSSSQRHGGSRRVHEVPLAAGVEVRQQGNGVQLQ